MKKWIAGILAAVIAGVVIYYLTEGFPKPAPSHGSVYLFEHTRYQGRQVSLENGEPKQIEDLKRNKNYNFGDQTSSIRWSLGPRCKFELYEHDHFQKILKTLVGKGEISDLGEMSEKISSVKWSCS